MVIGQVMSYNDPGFSAFWSRGTSSANPASATSLWVGKHVGEDPVKTRAIETVGYIVMEAGSRNLNGRRFLAGLGGDTIQGMGNGPPYIYALSGLSSVSTAVVSMSGMDGGTAVGLFFMVRIL